MNRFTEPSTWAGLATLFQVAKMFVPANLHICLDGATAVAGALAGVMPEKAKSPAPVVPVEA